MEPIYSLVGHTEVKNQVKALPNFKEMDKKLHSMMLMTIKKIVYTGGSDNLHAEHNKEMANINLIGLYQENFQDIHFTRFVLNLA